MPPQLLDIFRRCADEQIKIFGRSYEAVKSHGRGADEHIFESDRLELTKHAHDFISVHAGRITRQVCRNGI